MRGQTVVEKIVQKFVVGLEGSHVQKRIYSGDFVSIRPSYCMTHDNTAAVLQKYRKSFAGYQIKDPRQIVFTADHNIQDTSEKNLAKYQDMMRFAQSSGIDCYKPGRGIGHQIMIEEGYASPNKLVVASDSHSNMYGGVGCLGTPVVRSDAAGIWVSGQTWWIVPPVVRVNLTGTMSFNNGSLSGKDVIIALCGLLNKDQVLNCAVEFHGEGVKSLSIDDRLTIANMTTEWGALAGLFPLDQTCIDWYKSRVSRVNQELSQYRQGNAAMRQIMDLDYQYVPSFKSQLVTESSHPRLNSQLLDSLKQQLSSGEMTADPTAVYSKEITLDLSSIRDQFVSGPDAVKIGTQISFLSSAGIPNNQAGGGIKIQKAYLVSCTNSRLSDLQSAAQVLKALPARKRHVHPDVELYVSAASSQVQRDAEWSGDWQVLLNAGARPLPSGCGPCIGLGAGLLKDGEVGISSTNRNFKGRMGSRNAQTYLASPSVVTASAIAGFICAPQHLQGGNLLDDTESQDQQSKVQFQFKQNNILNSDGQSIEMLDGFQSRISGRLLFCNADNLNTDGIYPGRYTYKDDLTPQEMAQVAMENYDPDFQRIAVKGDILVGGKNFGSGSSREQAATCLKFRGIRLVIAESFSDIYKRNAFNNGLICLECPQLVQSLRSKFHYQSVNTPTINTEIMAQIDFNRGVLSTSGVSDQSVDEFRLPQLGVVAQKLIVQDGLENWLKSQQSGNQSSSIQL
ncbi:hypothetical protein MIR68_006291 [Amoeboaphelidium protococcarum]|nr:hypothetical protein MIR68_006291 [Amoeboaphelidium protococcarum]